MKTIGKAKKTARTVRPIYPRTVPIPLSRRVRVTWLAAVVVPARVVVVVAMGQSLSRVR
jgi:hypothetical protein